jgi:hypothetical protein
MASIPATISDRPKAKLASKSHAGGSSRRSVAVCSAKPEGDQECQRDSSRDDEGRCPDALGGSDSQRFA